MELQFFKVAFKSNCMPHHPSILQKISFYLILQRITKWTTNFSWNQYTYNLIKLLTPLPQCCGHRLVTTFMRKAGKNHRKSFNKNVCVHWCIANSFAMLLFALHPQYIKTGQLISKANFKVFIWTKKPTEIFLYFFPSFKKIFLSGGNKRNKQ